MASRQTSTNDSSPRTSLAARDARSYKEMIDSSPSFARIDPAADMPDMSRKISKLNAAADRAAHWSILRIVLAIVAVQVIAFALPALLLGEEQDVDDPLGHGISVPSASPTAWRCWSSWHVRRGPVRSCRSRWCLAGAQVLGAIVDLATGRIPLVGEARHLPQIISVFLIWFLLSPTPCRRSRPGERRARVVDGERRPASRRAAVAALTQAGSSSSRAHPGH